MGCARCDDRPGRTAWMLLHKLSDQPIFDLSSQPAGGEQYTREELDFEGIPKAGVRHIPHLQPLRTDLRKGVPSVVPLADRAIGNVADRYLPWVSNPQLHIYLDEFVFRHNRRRSPMAAFQTLLGLGAGQPPTPYRRIQPRRQKRSTAKAVESVHIPPIFRQIELLFSSKSRKSVLDSPLSRYDHFCRRGS